MLRWSFSRAVIRVSSEDMKKYFDQKNANLFLSMENYTLVISRPSTSLTLS